MAGFKFGGKQTNSPNIFQKVGLSGIEYSSYLGEWKYYDIDPCEENSNQKLLTMENITKIEKTHNQLMEKLILQETLEQNNLLKDSLVHGGLLSNYLLIISS